MIERITKLEEEIEKLKKQLECYKTMTVDLRIDGVIQPVTILVLEKPKTPIFTIVDP